MADTLYASFADVSLAEKATGALLDHGVLAEDISLISNRSDDAGNTGTVNSVGTSGSYNTGTGDNYRSSAVTDRTTTGTSGTYDNDNDLNNTGDAVVEGAKSVGERLQAGGNRIAGAVNDVIGNDSTAQRYHQNADQHDRNAEQRWSNATSEARDAVDADGSNYSDQLNYDATRPSNVRTGTTPGVNQTSTDTSASIGDSGQTFADTTPYDSNVTRGDDDLTAKTGLSTTTPEDAGAGAVKGTGIGLGIGALAALASLFIPGVGLVTGGGALAAALGGLAATTGAGALAGAVTGYLKDQGLPDEAVSHYETTLTGGGAVLSVHVPSNNVDRATIEDTLRKYGATNLNTYDTTGTGGNWGSTGGAVA